MSVTALPAAAEGDALISWVAEHILPRVQKPVRYIGNEPGSEPSRDTHAGDILFMFPDVYEIGVGNVGMSLLRDTVNSCRDLAAETAYCPWPDMEELMRESGVPVYSLESYRRALSFDVIGITIQHELCYTNILTMLSLSGIPLIQSQRSDTDPYIIGGGPGVFNPEPVAEFFDLIVMGEGEDIICDLVRVLSSGKREKQSREEVLHRALDVEGVYIPSLYMTSHRCAGRGVAVSPRFKGVPASIPLHHNTAFPRPGITPRSRISLTAPTHDRLSVEIMRGCPGGCLFCQAKRYYGPVRTKGMDAVMNEIEHGTTESGFGDVSLLGLSCSDYPAIHELLDRANRYLLPRNASLSLPSLRADSFSEEICMQLGRFRKGGFTFAPEAGSDTLRRRLGKPLTNEEILTAIDTVLSHGGTGVKLYFMIGIPGERVEDIRAVVSLCRDVLKLIKKHRARRLTVSIAPLVPKPHTPLERFAFEDISELKRKRRMIADALTSSRIHLRWRSEEYSRLEAIFSRGDRRLTPVILEAWRSGARFDGWEKELKAEIWEHVFEEAEVDWREYLREYTRDEVLPWAHISCGGRGRDRLCPEVGNDIPAGQRPPVREFTLPRCGDTPRGRLRIRFSKKGLFRFLSHLDLMRLWSMIFRKSSLAITYTSGYSPRPKMSFGPALPVGFESTGEYLDVWISSDFQSRMMTDLSKVIPDDLKPVTVTEIPLKSPSLGSILKGASYQVRFPESVNPGNCNSHDRIPEGIVLHEIHDRELIFSVTFNNPGIPKPRSFISDHCRIDENIMPFVAFTRIELWTSPEPGHVSEEPGIGNNCAYGHNHQRG